MEPDTDYRGHVTTGTWDVGGTIGFWKNWDKHNTYTESQINGWLGIIDENSAWLVPDMDEDGIDIDDMEDILWNKCKADMECKFLKYYLATRLNMETERLDPDREHDSSTIEGYEYLSLDNPSSATLSEIVAAIESKYPDDPSDPDAVWPTDAQCKIMKNICDAINNLEI